MNLFAVTRYLSTIFMLITPAILVNWLFNLDKFIEMLNTTEHYLVPWSMPITDGNWLWIWLLFSSPFALLIWACPRLRQLAEAAEHKDFERVSQVSVKFATLVLCFAIVNPLFDVIGMQLLMSAIPQDLAHLAQVSPWFVVTGSDVLIVILSLAWWLVAKLMSQTTSADAVTPSNLEQAPEAES